MDDTCQSRDHVTTRFSDTIVPFVTAMARLDHTKGTSHDAHTSWTYKHVHRRWRLAYRNETETNTANSTYVVAEYLISRLADHRVLRTHHHHQHHHKQQQLTNRSVGQQIFQGGGPITIHCFVGFAAWTEQAGA